MIGVDWGISSVRAYRLCDGRVTDRREQAAGILAVSDGRFAEMLGELVAPWLSDGEERVLLSGMIGSRQGWKESGTVPCPAGITDLARALTPVPFAGAAVRIVPGVASADEAGTPEFMRGEETQIVGAAILGTGGDEAIHGILDVMTAGAAATTLRRSMPIHPTVSELIPTVLGDLVSGA